MNIVKLFCFPYGGGSATIYHDWKKYLSKNIELHPVELAARGSRMRDPNYDSIDEAADDVLKIIRNDLEIAPYAFFGHSLGSMIAFELAYKIRKEGLPYPIHIFFAGRGAPHMPWHEKKKYYKLQEDEFRKEVMALGGIPKEFLEVPEFMDMLFTLLRGDYKIAETYSFIEKDAPLDCGITLLNATNDEASREDIEAWKVHAGKECNVHYFEGGHFFLREETEKILDIINATLSHVTFNR